MSNKKIYTIFGNPVSHSKSPLMHNISFKELNYNGCYTRYKLENGEELRDKFFELGIAGANITVPYKEVASKICDWLDEFAQKVGAVNTIVKRDNQLYGYNTDALGFLKAISKLKDIKNVLFLGAGGTAQATSTILRNADYRLTILNRSPQRLEKFKKEGFETYTFESFKNNKRFDLIVNMTSAGLEDDSLPSTKEILDTVIPNAKSCVDIIYGKETPFLKLAKEYGIPTKDGREMLLYQGIIAFQHFTDYQFTFSEIKEHMQKAFLYF